METGIDKSFTSSSHTPVFANFRRWLWRDLPWRPPKALVEQAAIALRNGDRFQFPIVAIESGENIRTFINSVTKVLDENIRASVMHGSVMLYLDNGESEGLGIVLAYIK